jgi:hypothetical protein
MRWAQPGAEYVGTSIAAARSKGRRRIDEVIFHVHDHKETQQSSPGRSFDRPVPKTSRLHESRARSRMVSENRHGKTKEFRRSYGKEEGVL